LIRPASSNAAGLTHSRLWCSSGEGRYLDPEGGFLRLVSAVAQAVLLLEVAGDPAKPRVEQEVRACLARGEHGGAAAMAGSTDASPHTATRCPSGGAVALWFDAGRCFSDMPKIRRGTDAISAAPAAAGLRPFTRR